MFCSFPAQGQIEVESETVFKLAALILQVSGSSSCDSVGFQLRVTQTSFSLAARCLSGFWLVFFFSSPSIKTKPRSVVYSLRSWGGGLKKLGAGFFSPL